MKKVLALFLVLITLAVLANGTGEQTVPEDPKAAIVGTWYNTMILASLEDGGELPPVGSGYENWTITIRKDGTFTSTRYNVSKEKEETHKGKWKYDKKNNQYLLNNSKWKKSGLNKFWLDGDRLMHLGARPGVKNIPTVFEREKREPVVLNTVSAEADAFLGLWLFDVLDYNGFRIKITDSGIEMTASQMDIKDGTALYTGRSGAGEDVIIHYSTQYENNQLKLTPTDDDTPDPNIYYLELLDDGQVSLAMPQYPEFIFIGHRID